MVHFAIKIMNFLKSKKESPWRTPRRLLKILIITLFVASVAWRYFYGRNIGIGNKSGVETAVAEVIGEPPTKQFDITGEFAIVKRAIDGDTVELENGKKVRYIGIDTPETLDPRKPVQCFGKEAAEKNRELVEGKRVRLEKDVTERDKYNRLLRYIYVTEGESGNEIFVNLELVNQGFAHSYTYPPDVKYQNLFVLAEKEARENGRGLWIGCPIQPESVSLSPTGVQISSPDEGCKIKGNISASGEKIYHLFGCGSYDKTKIDESRGEKWFCSEDEAVNSGWRKAKNC